MRRRRRSCLSAAGREVSTAGSGLPDRRVTGVPVSLLLDVLLVVALGWVLWVTAAAEGAKVVAASGNGRPGTMVIEGLRPARGADIPVGSFVENDQTVTSGVAWQDRPAAVGERKQGVRVGDRAWEPGVRVGLADVLVSTAVIALLGWRLLVLARRWRRRAQPRL